MSRMKKFQMSLAASSENQGSYMMALIALTKVNPVQLVAMTSALDWQAW